MNLNDTIQRELDKLPASSVAETQPHLVSIDTEVGRLECEMTAIDSIACSFRRFTLHTDALAGADTDQLKSLSESLSRQLTYLLEPISPIEIDQDRCVVQMRSNPPAKDENSTTYYELLVQRGGQLDLSRFAKASGQPRQTVSASVTREVLTRLASDFVAAVS